MIKFPRWVWNKILLKIDLLKYSTFKNEFSENYQFTKIFNIWKNKNDIYKYMHHYFCHLAPVEIVEHRKYFKNKKRGYGEDAFHAMWYKLFEEFRPKLALEIGVYRGQVITLWGVISKLLKINCEIHGVSPFTSSGDQVSKYLTNVDYKQDVLNACNLYDLNSVNLYRAYSTEENAIKYIKNKKWNLIYIDGNHDYDVALSDYLLCKDSLADGGILVIDDSSLYTDYLPPKFAFAGHPGPTKIVNDYALKDLEYIGSVGHNNIFRKFLI
jgi:hypothetical protein